MSSVMPVLSLIGAAWQRLVVRVKLADVRWALRNIDPFNPDRHMLEGKKAKLERML